MHTSGKVGGGDVGRGEVGGGDISGATDAEELAATEKNRADLAEVRVTELQEQIAELKRAAAAASPSPRPSPVPLPG